MFCVYLCRHLHCAAANTDSILSKTNGVPGFQPKKGTFSCIEMNGKEVFRFAVRCVPQSLEKALEEAGLPASSIDWLLLHQVSILLMKFFDLRHRSNDILLMKFFDLKHRSN